MVINGVITFPEAQAHERAMLDKAREMRADEAQHLVWRTGPAVIVPRGTSARENFERCAAAIEACGYPVFERDTGGDLTPQDPGVINYTAVFRMDGEGASLRDAYLRLTAPILAFLKDELGLEPHLSAIPGAFCDGAFNIAIGDRKLAGTAQRWKLLGGEGAERRVAVLGHVALMATNDLGPAVHALNAYYDAASSGRRIELNRHVTLSELIGTEAAEPESLARRLALFLKALSA